MESEHRAGLQVWLLAVLVGLLAWIYVRGIATNPAKWEEPRRCLIAAEMLRTGDWIVPRLLGQPYLNKPPLQIWLVALAAGGDPDRVRLLDLRLISLASVFGVAILLWRLGTSDRTRADPRPALVFLTTAIVVQFARAGEIDALFTFLTTAAVAVFEWGRRRRSPWLAWFAPQPLVAAGVLTKMIAPLYFYPVVLLCAWRRPREFRFAPLPFAAGLVLAMGLVGAWFVPYASRASLPALWGRWGDQLSDRTLDSSVLETLLHVPLFPLIVIGTLLPWSAYALGLAARRSDEDPPHTLMMKVRSRLRAAIDATAEDPWLFLAATAAAVGIVPFVFVPGLRERYLVPAVPWVAVLFASVWERSTRRPLAAPRVRALRWAWGSIAVLWVAWLAVEGRRAAGSVEAVVIPGLLGLTALVVLAVAKRAGRRATLGHLLLLVGLLYGIAFAGVREVQEAHRNAVWRPIATALAAPVGDDRPLLVHAGVPRKLAWELQLELDRTPVLVDAPGAGPSYWVAPAATQAPAPAARVAASGGYAIWRVPAHE